MFANRQTRYNKTANKNSHFAVFTSRKLFSQLQYNLIGSLSKSNCRLQYSIQLLYSTFKKDVLSKKKFCYLISTYWKRNSTIRTEIYFCAVFCEAIKCSFSHQNVCLHAFNIRISVPYFFRVKFFFQTVFVTVVYSFADVTHQMKKCRHRLFCRYQKIKFFM